MSSTSLNHPFNLSLLSRGVGEVKLNGHEKVEVVLEPEDYMNYAAGESTILPPLQPQYAHVPLQPMYSMGSSPRNSLQARESCQELHVPKTFTTRKGALLLFSEDYALKNRFHETDSEQEEKTSQNKDLRTVEDLTNSILKYGSRRHGTPEINLHFLHDRNIRRVRPGFSARRYLSRLTRSFDDNFLDSMLTKGFIYEKSIFENNAYLPSSTKRRIDDDLSYMPAPYRIMKQMLMAPGMLSGFSFYRSLTLDSEFTGALTILQEEESTDPSSAGLEVVEVKDGIRHSINYEGLSKEEQENVLADLLVKSAINHAMEKQEKNMLSGPKNEEDGIGSPSTIEFNMGEAVQEQFPKCDISVRNCPYEAPLYFKFDGLLAVVADFGESCHLPDALNEL
ncbi:hypothetical protein CAPTEDRAFT_219271 [Capitella teleta]|uniref:Uncharacterized protein n=1 Tax=Capitella teleta TaxID=283909 RepID=R7U506_CAPTE|nr:hypothetical protein CAPTEDRAFT_219271 [Capitella teleta]|eukprot:ELU01044.1 hypothetical protein CAPTEDRAFT_219271 [Capitella teleta]